MVFPASAIFDLALLFLAMRGTIPGGMHEGKIPCMLTEAQNGPQSASGSPHDSEVLCVAPGLSRAKREPSARALARGLQGPGKVS